MKPVTILLIAFFCYFSSFAQSNILENEQLLKQYLEQKKFNIDTSAQAVILYEKGYISASEARTEYKVDRIVKILGMNAVDEFGTVALPKSRYTSANKIVGETYNLENGNVVKQTIEHGDILKDKITDRIDVTKYNLPSVKAGSIIHISFVIVIPMEVYIPDWTFQNNYPTLYSEYEIKIPKRFEINTLPRVNVTMAKVNSREELTNHEGAYCIEPAGRFTLYAWARKNIPAFKAEPYMSSEDNYLERVKINIKQISSLWQTTGLYNSWNDMSRKFYEDKTYCGQAFSKNNFLNEDVEKLITNKTSDLDKAKSIFYFVRDNYSEKKDNSNKYRTSNIKDIFYGRSGLGTNAGINLLLIAMLRKAGFNSEPILLATKNTERLNESYPENCNYLVCRLKIEQKEYYLDASERQMPFGVLFPACYNGYARVISEIPNAVTLSPDSLLNKTTVVVNIAPADTPNHFKLIVDEQYGTFTSLMLRRGWDNDSTEAREMATKYVNKINVGGKVKDLIIKNLNTPDLPLAIHYEADIHFNKEEETIYFDPYIVNFFNKNPFTATERKYPVEMDYKDDITYMLRMQLPKNYVIDDYPKSASFALTNKRLMTMENTVGYDNKINSLMINSRFVSNATMFSPEMYHELRHFYEEVIEETGKKIVIKKVN